jgi:hypothetical protein
MSDKNLQTKLSKIILTAAILICLFSLLLIFILKSYTLNLGFVHFKVDNPLPWMVALLIILSITYWQLNSSRIDVKKNLIFNLLKKADTYHVLLLSIFMVCLYFFHYYGGRIGSDGLVFYRWVWSFLFSGQPDPWSSEIFEFKIRYLASPAPLWFPFLLLGHFFAWAANLFGRFIPLNGASYPYVNAVCLSSLLYAFIGIILIYELLKNYFSKRISFFSVVALWLGAFPLWYMIYQPTMPQCASLFSVALFIYVWFKSQGNRSIKGWIWLFVLAMLTIAIRPYNIIYLLFPIIEVIQGRVKLLRTKKWALLKSSVIKDLILLIVFAVSLYFLFHMIRGWKFIRNPNIFQWSKPKIGELFFSSYHGLLSWTPLIYISLIGFPFMFKKDKRMFLYLLICFLALVYILSSVTDWQAGDSYGSRRFTGAFFIFTFTLAALIEKIKEHPYLLLGVIIACFVLGNILFMDQYNKAQIPHLDTISFNRTQQKKISSFYQRFGHPFSFPANVWFRLRYGVPLENFDRIFGHRPYHNLSIDIGSQQDEPFLGKGWYGSESYQGAFSFRWSKGKESNILVSLFDAFNYQLELKAAPFSYAKSPEQGITIYINGEKASSIKLRNGFNSYKTLIPKSYWKPGLNEIKFHYQYCQQPRAVMESNDGRLLGVAIDYVKLQIIK